MTQENKSNRKLIYIMAALFAIVLVGLNVVITSYYFEMKNKDAQIKQLNDEIDSIQTQLANITLPSSAPNLISIGMNCSDNRTDPNAPFLHVTGYVVNVGAATANDCTVRAFAIQSGNSTAIDTTTAITSLAPGAYETIDLKFPYSGSPLIAFSSNVGWKN